MNTFLSPFLRLCAALALMALPARAITVNATFNSATDIPVTSSGYTATGNTLNLTLNFAPAVGTELTVVKNTALPFIQGYFDNLSQGQKVDLSFGGSIYSFIANYYGGSGNDLVLTWADTRAYTWGYNVNGQIGNGSTVNSNIPVTVNNSETLAGKTILSIATGSRHTLALCSDGSLAAWGRNFSGELGNGNNTDSNLPVNVATSGSLSGKTVISIAAGGSSSMALCSDGTLAAWGDGSSGQHGNGSYTNSNLPVLVNTSGVLAGKTIVSIATGGAHSIVLCTDGTIAAWGSNNNGQLGNGNNTSSNIPVLVNTTGVLSGKTVTSIATGAACSMALCTDGTVAAWGYNFSGQLGNGNNTNSNLPVLINTSGVLAGKTAISIAAGGSHSMVLCSDGTLAAWGYNVLGQLGNGNNANSNLPVLVNSSGVLAGKTAISISAGDNHSMSLCSDGTIASWGENINGQHGNGNNTNSNVPVLANSSGVSASKWKMIVAGGYHNIALNALPLPPPEIAVFNGAVLTRNYERQSNVGVFTLPAATMGNSSSPQILTIKNTGPSILTGLALSVTGNHLDDFTTSNLGSTTLGADQSMTFTVTFTPTVAGDRNAVVQIASNDSDENPFLIKVAGRDYNNVPVTAADSIERVAMKSTKVSVAALVANDTDADGDTLVITSVDSATPAGTTVTTDGAWVYFTPPSDSAAPGGFSYTISDGFGGTAVGTVTVNIKGASNGTSLSQTKAQSEPAPGGGTQMRVTFIGIPDREYTIQATDSLTPPNWQSIGTARANAQGVYQFVDPPPLPPSRFYRAVYP